MKKKYPLFLLLFFFLLLIEAAYLSDNNLRSSTQAATVRVSGTDIAAIQTAVNSARDGDTVLIPAGKYITSVNSPCALDLGSKKITLKGEGNPMGTWTGTVIFGEGHDQPYVFTKRAGICSTGGDVTIDNIHLKEFEGGGMRLTNSKLIIKNSLVDGHDSGGLILRNSSVLAVNNYFVANFGFLYSGTGGVLKGFNNTFYASKAINTNCNETVPPIDFVNNIVVDDELIIGAGWIFGDCPATAAQFKTKNIQYNLFWKNNNPCYPNHEFCDDFTGKILADPMFIEPVIDQRGIAGWANFGFREGSPAVGAGSPSIPGTRNLGASGGPCTDGTSSMCLNFIAANMPLPPATPTQPQPTGEPTATSGPTLPPGVTPTTTPYPTIRTLSPTPTITFPTFGQGTPVPSINPTTGQPYPTFPQGYPTPTPTGGSIFDWFFPKTNPPTPTPVNYRGTFTIENISTAKSFKVRYLVVGQTVKVMEQILPPKGYLTHDFSWNCSSPSFSFSAGLLFSSSKDNYQSHKFKNLTLSCDKREIVDLE